MKITVAVTTRRDEALTVSWALLLSTATLGGSYSHHSPFTEEQTGGERRFAQCLGT